MGFDTEFSMLSKRDLETISDYFKIEHEFMAPRSFYSLSSNARHRMHAVSMIAKVATTEPMDTYIPYVAVNYFDRFISTNSLTSLGELYEPLGELHEALGEWQKVTTH
ncbi:hypothetical protein VIGAN_07122300 [Vigna angularis var. angularis]|uniref:B-like cyclin n=1 Tax=Vigna angularis var. angularis TaxID=157739 RepID=A0A0S3SI17_PHAAN|nr:hypothetical protein VIGAN_07122300 [Vigna angularis var. angularis]